MRIALVTVFLLSLCPGANAAWSALAHVTPETRDEYAPFLCVTRLTSDPNTSIFRIPFSEPGEDPNRFVGQTIWLITTFEYVKPENQGFRVYIWDGVPPEERGLESPIESIELLEWKEDIGGFEANVSRDLMARSYLYMDYPRMVFDGGFYFSIDLSTFIDTDDGDCPMTSPSEFRLDQENGQSIDDASWSDVESALKSIDRESNSFFVLEGENGYVQTAGAADCLTVEHREVRADSYSHYRIGRKPLDKKMAPVRYSGGFIRVRESEVLTLEDCIAIFKLYFERGEIPDDYHLRELDDSYL